MGRAQRPDRGRERLSRRRVASWRASATAWSANANCGAIPYFTKYFKEYADFNLKERYNLPFESLYGISGGGQPIRYPRPKDDGRDT